VKLSPQQNTSPERVTAHVWFAPALIATNVSPVATTLALDRRPGDGSSLPSCPSRFEPQQ
jgi:hypothetical protein